MPGIPRIFVDRTVNGTVSAYRAADDEDRRIYRRAVCQSVSITEKDLAKLRDFRGLHAIFSHEGVASLAHKGTLIAPSDGSWIPLQMLLTLESPMLSRMREFTGETYIALMLAAIAGCGEGADQSAASESETPRRSRDDQEDFSFDEAALRANVGRKLKGCEGIRDACQSDAGLAPPTDECKDEISACVSEVVEEALKFFGALHECQKTALACVEDGEDRATCHAGFDRCIEGVLRGDAGGDAGRSRADGGVPRGGDRDTDSDESGPRGGGTITPTPSIDGGTRGVTEISPVGDGFGSDCVTQLQECAESGADAEACAASTTACVGG